MTLSDQADEYADIMWDPNFEPDMQKPLVKSSYTEGYMKAIDYIERRAAEGATFQQILWEIKLFIDNPSKTN